MVNALVSLLLPNLATGTGGGAGGAGLLSTNPFDGLSGALNFSSFLDLQGKPVDPATLPELLGTIKEEGGFETLLDLPDMELPDFEKIESLDQAIMVAAVIFPTVQVEPETAAAGAGETNLQPVSDNDAISPEEFVAEILKEMKQNVPGLTFNILKPALPSAPKADAGLEIADANLQTLQEAITSRLMNVQPAPAAQEATGHQVADEKVLNLTAAVKAPAVSTETPEEQVQKATTALTATVVPVLNATAEVDAASEPATADEVISQKMATPLVADEPVSEEAGADLPDEHKVFVKTSGASEEKDEELLKKKDPKSKDDKPSRLDSVAQASMQQVDEPAKPQRLQVETGTKAIGADDASSSQQQGAGDKQNNANAANALQQAQQSVQAHAQSDKAEFSFQKLMREAQGQHHTPLAEQITVNIKHAVHDQNDRIRIQLSPHDLGSVDITLTIKGDEITHIRVLAEKAETLDMLQRDSRFLERSLQESGLKADSGGLQFGLKGDQSGNAQNSQQDANEGRKYQPHYGMMGNSGEEEAKPLAWQEIGGTDVLIASTGINIRV